MSMCIPSNTLQRQLAQPLATQLVQPCSHTGQTMPHTTSWHSPPSYTPVPNHSSQQWCRACPRCRQACAFHQTHCNTSFSCQQNPVLIQQQQVVVDKATYVHRYICRQRIIMQFVQPMAWLPQVAQTTYICTLHTATAPHHIHQLFKHRHGSWQSLPTPLWYGWHGSKST